VEEAEVGAQAEADATANAPEPAGNPAQQRSGL